MVEMSGVKKFMVEQSGVEKFLLTLRLNCLGLKLGVEKYRVEMSCNRQFTMRHQTAWAMEDLYSYQYAALLFQALH